jgi:hypothetical protein
MADKWRFPVFGLLSYISTPYGKPSFPGLIAKIFKITLEFPLSLDVADTKAIAQT